MKNSNKNANKVYVNIKQHFLLWTGPTDLWCNMLETLEIRRKYSWYEIVLWNTLFIPKNLFQKES